MLEEIQSVLVESYNTFFNELASFLPSLIGAILILILGWIIAKLVQTAAVKLLKLIRLDVVTEKAKIDKFLKDGGSKKSAIDILGSIIYWLIMLIVILAGLNTLGLSVASELFNQIILYIPNVIVAVLALIFGVFLAGFIAQVVSTYLSNIGVKQANMVGAIAKYAIILFVVSLSLTQLSIGEQLVTNAFLLLFGAACLALGLAFGLGGKEWAAGVIEKLASQAENTPPHE
ncbi:mechanosensitive ion channel family protein [Gracilimonas sediminicola]|uniref:Uncharacterized protein n=1 Tax=Gracilimonas sediminicola TaxID=2952158 RepID=A0A9X2L261_9BACT|nr:hypothetical protein [Gracilimonas sediminicola]MCP9290941.1 hypothetical protein [Gracilimonas sediminicola]